MRTLLTLLAVAPLLARAQPDPTNITVTSAEADAVLHGTYDPVPYLPSALITERDEIVCHIERETSADSLYLFLEKLAGFHTRHNYSDTTSADTGIGAARRWIYSKFQQFSQRNEDRLIPSYMQFDIDASGLCGAGTFRNIFAVLPGRDTSDPSVIIIEAHADTRCEVACDVNCRAHGADDNGSGTAMVMELARVMSALSFDHTIVFMATVGEEQGLYGADAFSKYCLNNDIPVKAVQNNDIVGGVICGHTASPPGCDKFMAIDSTQIRIFSFGNTSSDHKGYARFVKMIYEECLLPIVEVPMMVSVMAPEDRTGRGGDHMPFRQRGYTAVRFTAANEYGNGAPDSTYLDHQHTSEDIIGYDTNGDQVIDSFLVDFNYLRRNTVINGVSAALAACGPDAPDFTIDVSAGNVTVNITDPAHHDHYRIGLRGTTGHDFQAVYTVKAASSHVVPTAGGTVRVSVAAVDSNNVMSLFATEQTKTGAPVSNNPSADTVEYRAVNCWPEGVERTPAGATPEHLRVAPNPFEDQTYIFIDQSAGSLLSPVLQVTDPTGRVMVSRPVGPGTGTSLLDGSQWPAGIYLVTLFSDGRPVGSQKITRVRR